MSTGIQSRNSLTVCLLGIFLAFLLSADIFQNQHFRKNSSENTIRLSNGLGPDQDPHSVGPHLGPNCLQRLSAKVAAGMERVKL